MKIIEIENGCKIFSWCPEIEEQAMEQMESVARLPYVKHVSLMPDCHLGMNTCIGSVVCCENVVVPDFCGSDAGCGMGAMRSSLHKDDIRGEDIRKRLLHSFSRSVPVGFARNSQKRSNELYNIYSEKIEHIIEETQVLSKYHEHNPIGEIRKEFTSQLGTLGGG